MIRSRHRYSYLTAHENIEQLELSLLLDSFIHLSFVVNILTDDLIPLLSAMIKQFLSDVYWRELDYLIIDTPPGTSDEHITIVESLHQYNPDGAILVTTPQVRGCGYSTSQA